MAVDVTKTIASGDDIWDADDVERGAFFTQQELKGIISFELTAPLRLNDRGDFDRDKPSEASACQNAEELSHLELIVPSAAELNECDSIREILSLSVQGIAPKALDGLDGCDLLRLIQLARHFVLYRTEEVRHSRDRLLNAPYRGTKIYKGKLRRRRKR